MYQVALRAIFEKCLGLRHGDDVLVICDETFDRFLLPTEEAIEEIGLEATIARISCRQQERTVQSSSRQSLGNYVSLPKALDAAIRASSAILNVLGPELSTSAFRRAVLEAKSNKSRVAHIPGLNDDILDAVLQTPFDEVAAQGELLAWVLGEAREGTIQTRDQTGRLHELKLALDGWENEPILSPGIIAEGDWGNVPAGEVFCCPSAAGVNGSICINGSIPHCVFEPGEEIILHFHHGKMTWENSAPTRALDFFRREQARAESLGDKHWNTFAELGFGLNPGIQGLAYNSLFPGMRRLTGNPLFDEKAARTIHVAVGDNSVFGHNVVANTHADLVTHCPTFLVDGWTVMREGELLIEDIRAARRGFVPPEPLVEGSDTIQLDERHCSMHSGSLRRRLARGKRVGYVDIGDPELTRRLTELYRALHAARSVSADTLYSDYPDFGGTPTASLVRVLHHYRMLKVKK